MAQPFNAASDPRLLQRIHGEYMEMPGLRLTIAQACRLWNVDAATSLDVQTALRDLNNSRTILTGQVYDNQVALRDLQRSEAAFQTMRVTRAAERFAPQSKSSPKDRRP